MEFCCNRRKNNNDSWAHFNEHIYLHLKLSVARTLFQTPTIHLPESPPDSPRESSVTTTESLPELIPLATPPESPLPELIPLSTLENIPERFSLSRPDTPNPTQNIIYAFIYKYNIELDFDKILADNKESIQLVLEIFMNKYINMPYMFVVDSKASKKYVPVYFMKNTGTNTISANIPSAIQILLVNHSFTLPINENGITMDFRFKMEI